jgi:hypothetical protein
MDHKERGTLKPCAKLTEALAIHGSRLRCVLTKEAHSAKLALYMSESSNA